MPQEQSPAEYASTSLSAEEQETLNLVKHYTGLKVVPATELLRVCKFDLRTAICGFAEQQKDIPASYFLSYMKADQAFVDRVAEESYGMVRKAGDVTLSTTWDVLRERNWDGKMVTVSPWLTSSASSSLAVKEKNPAASPKEYKLCLLGAGGVGKTVSLKWMTTGEFDKRYIATVGVDIKHVVLKRAPDFEDLVVNVWDCAGQAVLAGLASGYYIMSDAALIAFKDTPSAINAAKRYRQQFKHVCRDAPISFVEMQCPATRHPLEAKARKEMWAEEFGVSVETIFTLPTASAQHQRGLPDAIQSVIGGAILRKINQAPTTGTPKSTQQDEGDPKVPPPSSASAAPGIATGAVPKFGPADPSKRYKSNNRR